MTTLLRAPFPYVGGKRLAASMVWDAIGNPRVYVEPFAGSLAVLLARPDEPTIETVNDSDALLCNVWRAITLKPEETAKHADFPISEIDLHARHRALVLAARRGHLAEKLDQDPEHCDPKLAGWWIWGASQWIGGGWCADREKPKRSKPVVDHDKGVNAKAKVHKSKPETYGRTQGKDVHSENVTTPRRRPNVTNAGTGVQRKNVLTSEDDADVQRQMPQAHGIGGTGIHGHRVKAIYEWFEALSARLRRVRILSGDFERCLTRSVLYTEGSNAAGVFLDPPYAHTRRTKGLYAKDSDDVSARARKWAIEHGDDPRLRIVLAGLEGEHEMPPSWRKFEWEGHFGLGRSKGNDNRLLERLWLSPHCLGRDGPLFEAQVAT